MSARSLVVAVALSLVVACGGSKKEKPAPEKPFTGAPVAVQVDKLNKDSVDVSVYNFADKAVVSYWFLVRYKDAAGKVVKVKPGTPFESETDHMSMSGDRYRTSPKTWSSFRIDMLEVPEGAVTAEVLVKDVGTPGVQESLWSMDGIDWPEGH